MKFKNLNHHHQIYTSRTFLFGVFCLLILSLNFSFGMISRNPFNYKSEKIVDYTLELSNSMINIVTPENETYSESMRGYYPGTFSFDDVPNGEQSPFWIGGVDGEIFDEIDHHKKVYGIIDTSGSTGGDVRHEWTSAQINGTVESWMRFTSSTQGSAFYLRRDGTNLCVLAVNDGHFKYADNTGNHDISGAPIPQINTWYHIRFDFRGSYGGNYQGLSNPYTYRIFINGMTYGPFNYVTTNDLNRFQVHTGVAASGIKIYWDAVGYSWDPDYNIGDNLNQGLLISYSYRTPLEWISYSLDGQANKTLLGNNTITMPTEGFHNIQLIGNNSIGEIYASEIRYFTIKYFPINIITPENKTYTETMRGYYPATFGFENETVGTDPGGWSVYESGDTSIQIIDSKLTHNKLLEFYDNDVDVGDYCSALLSIGQTSGQVELWFLTQNSNEKFDIKLHDVSIENSLQLAIGASGTGKLEYNDGTWHEIMNIDNNRWYHIRIKFDTSSDWHIWVDGITQDGGSGYGYRGNPVEMDQVVFSTDDNPLTAYIDGLGFSWDSYYSIGDNLNEGLLLSYTNRTNLKWIGYSLDGEVNKTILGNKVIPLSGNDIHNIRAYGRNYSGFIFESPKRFFTINIPPPQISINSPHNNDSFGSNAPDFDISIISPISDTSWYTLDNGTTKIIFYDLLGTIDQFEWDKLAQGLVTIRFYVNDTFGQENYSEIFVYKVSYSSTPQPFNFLIHLIILGSFGIMVSLVIIIKYALRRKTPIKATIHREEIITEQQFMRCPNCLSKLHSSYKFCTNCGSKLKE
jgi:hypothetical protein